MRSLSVGERDILAQDGPDRGSEHSLILNSRRLKARKAHECDGCQGTCFAQYIRAGEFYHQMVVIDSDDGKFKVLRFCHGTPERDGG